MKHFKHVKLPQVKNKKMEVEIAFDYIKLASISPNDVLCHNERNCVQVLLLYSEVNPVKCYEIEYQSEQRLLR